MVTLKQFVDFNNDLVAEWMNAKQTNTLPAFASTNPTFTMYDRVVSNLIVDDLPEPYYGKPAGISLETKPQNNVVVINANPYGDPDILSPLHCFWYATGCTNYLEFAAKILTNKKSTDPGAYEWFMPKWDWINDRIFNGNGKISDALSIELCPFHSPTFGDISKQLNSNNQLKNHINNYVIEPMCEAISNSTFGIGITFKKNVHDVLISHYNFSPVKPPITIPSGYTFELIENNEGIKVLCILGGAWGHVPAVNSTFKINEINAIQTLTNLPLPI